MLCCKKNKRIKGSLRFWPEQIESRVAINWDKRTVREISLGERS